MKLSCAPRVRRSKHWILPIFSLRIGRENNTLPIPLIMRFFLRMREPPAILRETSYRHIPKCNERFARQYRHEPPRKCHLSGPTHALTENAVKITVTQTTLEITVGCTCTYPSIHAYGDSNPSANPTPSTTTRKRACERTETSVRHRWSSVLSFESCYCHQGRGGWREA